jgi:hypothetical protein
MIAYDQTTEEKPAKSKSLDQIATLCAEKISFAEGHEKSIELRDRANLGQSFYRGGKGHWTQEEWNVYQSKGVQPITINRCLRTVETLSGNLADNKPDFKVMPRRGGLEVIANIKTCLMKHTADLSGLDHILETVYQAGNVMDEAYILLKFDKNSGPNGQVRFEAKTCYAVYPDPLCKEYDLNSPTGMGQYFVEREWMDKDEFVAEFEGQVQDNGIEGVAINDPNNIAGFLLGGTDYAVNDDEQLEGQGRYKVLVRHVWWKEWVRGSVITNLANGDQRILTNEKLITEWEARIKKGLRGYKLRKAKACKLHHTRMCAGKAMDDEVNPFSDYLTELPCFRFAPHFSDGYSFGALDNIIPINIEENKQRTNALRYMTATVNSGWKGKKPKNEKARREIEEFGSVNGRYWDIDNYGGMLERIAPLPFPEAAMAMAQQCGADTKDISGVNDPSMGNASGPNESGRAVIARQEQAKKTNQPQLARLFWTMMMAGDYLQKLLTYNKIYTEEEIRALVGEQGIINEGTLKETFEEFKDKFTMGQDLPKPPPLEQLMASNPIEMAEPEDQPMAAEIVQLGVESATQYAKKYPQLLSKWDKVIREYTMRKVIGQLNDSTIGQYGVTVIISQSSPTVRASNRAEMMAINQSYPGVIPPEDFLESTDLPDKEGLKNKIIQRQQMMQQQPQPAMAGA